VKCLALPNQYCYIITLGIFAGFKVDFLCGAPPQSYYESLLWFMILCDQFCHVSAFSNSTVSLSRYPKEWSTEVSTLGA